ncbi:MAG: DinB family protein [Gemmatimonadales bacterium]
MIPLSAAIAGILSRDLVSLRKEVEAYPSDAELWQPAPGTTNPGGTLAIHLAGNLQHFVGAVLGGSGYVRDRDAEFSTRDLSRTDVIARIDAAIRAVEDAFTRLTDADLGREYPVPIGKFRVETGDFLVHLVSHLAYHLGQVDYHRRIVTGTGVTVSTVAPGRLRSAQEAA